MDHPVSNMSVMNMKQETKATHSVDEKGGAQYNQGAKEDMGGLDRNRQNTCERLESYFKFTC